MFVQSTCLIIYLLICVALVRERGESTINLIVISSCSTLSLSAHPNFIYFLVAIALGWLSSIFNCLIKMARHVYYYSFLLALLKMQISL